jgi:hypothetical protein
MYGKLPSPPTNINPATEGVRRLPLKIDDLVFGTEAIDLTCPQENDP